MIVARSPLRLSLGGGGTDLPSYYSRNGGFLVAAAIDKYVDVSVEETRSPDIVVRSSRVERVRRVEEIQHPIVREALRLVGHAGGLEITSGSEIPPGTGLGSSGSFATALLLALHALRGIPLAPGRLAELACEVEMGRLGEPVGKQDPYIAAFGGVTCFRFEPDGRVVTSPLQVAASVLSELESRLLLCFTGLSRSASDVLRDQDARTRRDDPETLKNLRAVHSMGLEVSAALENGRLGEFGRLMDEHWFHKKRRTPAATNDRIDSWYLLARRHGALGGKLVGAGGGGFLLFLCDDRERLAAVLEGAGLRIVPFVFDPVGSRVLLP